MEGGTNPWKKRVAPSGQPTASRRTRRWSKASRWTCRRHDSEESTPTPRTQGRDATGRTLPPSSEAGSRPRAEHHRKRGRRPARSTLRRERCPAHASHVSGAGATARESRFPVPEGSSSSRNGSTALGWDSLGSIAGDGGVGAFGHRMRWQRAADRCAREGACRRTVAAGGRAGGLERGWPGSLRSRPLRTHERARRSVPSQASPGRGQTRSASTPSGGPGAGSRAGNERHRTVRCPHATVGATRGRGEASRASRTTDRRETAHDAGERRSRASGAGQREALTLGRRKWRLGRRRAIRPTSGEVMAHIAAS